MKCVASAQRSRKLKHDGVRKQSRHATHFLSSYHMEQVIFSFFVRCIFFVASMRFNLLKTGLLAYICKSIVYEHQRIKNYHFITINSWLRSYLVIVLALLPPLRTLGDQSWFTDCVCACLSVCLQDKLKSYGRIFDEMFSVVKAFVTLLGVIQIIIRILNTDWSGSAD